MYVRRPRRTGVTEEITNIEHGIMNEEVTPAVQSRL